MPIYQFRCLKCDERMTELCRVGTTATRCSHCGDFAVLIPSVPAKAIIRPASDEGGVFSAPLPHGQGQAVSSGGQDENAVRVYDFEFDRQGRENLERLVDKEMRDGVSDGYSI